jgi:hypothetical protein
MTTTAKKVSPKLGVHALQDLFADFSLNDKGGYITQEFQDFGYRLAVSLDDLKHKSLYIRLAKTLPRTILENALSFVTDAPNVKSKARLFMWKLKELKQEKGLK